MNVDRCPWYIAGPLLGLLIVGLRAVVNKPFGALGGYVECVNARFRPAGFGFRTFLLFGLIVGGVLYAMLDPGAVAIDYAWAGSPLPNALPGLGALYEIEARRTVVWNRGWVRHGMGTAHRSERHPQDAAPSAEGLREP